jgi:hypothetical protein
LLVNWLANFTHKVHCPQHLQLIQALFAAKQFCYAMQQIDYADRFAAGALAIPLKRFNNLFLFQIIDPVV